jgi:hypothetical protein
VIGVVDPNSRPRIADAELRMVAQRWAELPTAIRAGILAMVNASMPDAPAQPVAETADVQRLAVRVIAPTAQRA